jgi:hypothetical protein
MVEVVVLYDKVLGRTGTTYDDSPEILNLREPVGAGPLCGLLEEVVSRFLDQPLKALGRLPAPPVL